MKILLYLLPFYFLAGGNPENDHTHKSTIHRIDEWHTITVSKNEQIYVYIKQDSLYNLFIAAYDKHRNVYGSQAVMFSDVIRQPTLITAVQLDNTTKEKEFVIKSFNKGSTYGAQSLFIIWTDDYTWYVTRDIFQRDIFQRAMLEDRNKDGVYEIVEYYGSSNKKGKVYRFRNGGFQEL
ncbi:hypothetical protein QNI19_19160 [Cytophagaceae bacterium DM2B3-1]|uniref:Uncharacterized protein n=1 Tax=Xanthocytophaga flava TaxID=3048013 RepID=A0ABT7CNE1_9BACT|nr:hypothetical protein [Xanthocytophaga flavus]MDJ1495066.1 hypothetical protein [Xanthocytophaga flavus]